MKNYDLKSPPPGTLVFNHYAYEDALRKLMWFVVKSHVNKENTGVILKFEFVDGKFQFVCVHKFAQFASWMPTI